MDAVTALEELLYNIQELWFYNHDRRLLKAIIKIY